jgi:drug/metabolite transporter (DMT)-like permease
VAELALLTLTLAWGTTFWIVGHVLVDTSPGVFLSLRFALATFVVGVVWLARRDRPTPHAFRHGSLLGVMLGTGFLLQTQGLRFTTPARSAFLTGLAVLFVPFLGRVLLGRAVQRRTWLGVALALFGLLLLTNPFAEESRPGMRVGDLLTVFCAVAFGLHVLFTAEWSPRHPLPLLTLLQIAVTLVASLILFAVEDPHLAPGSPLVGAILYTGVVMTAGAFFLQSWAQRHTTAVRAALIFSLEPVAAALFAWLAGDHPLTRWEIAGGVLIVAGVIAAEALPARR